MDEQYEDEALGALIDRAQALRFTMEEIAEAAQTNTVAIWRWRQGAKPAWDRRERALEGLEAAIEARKEEYARA